MISRRILILWTFRLLMAGLLVFEFLNSVGILHFTLDFSWHGLMLTGAFCWVSVELALWLVPEMRVGLALPLLALSMILDASGDFFHLYSRVPHYDKFLHFFGGAVVTGFAYEVLRNKLFVPQLGRLLPYFLIVCVGAMLGMLYEIEEYAEDVLVNHRQLRMGDSFDTGADLSLDLVGSIFAVVITAVLRRLKAWRIRAGKGV